MSYSYKKRINTINTLIAGSDIQYSPNFASIILEFQETDNCKKIRKINRKYITMILHSTRALDSSMAYFLQHNSIRNYRNGNRAITARSIGQYIDALALHNNNQLNRITQQERTNYKNRIANIRNNFMHTAGAYPTNSNEVNNLLSEMHSLLSRMFTL